MVRYGRPIPILERGALGLYLRQKRNDLEACRKNTNCSGAARVA